MGRISKLWKDWNKRQKISSSDPVSFEERWSFQASSLQLFSFIILIAIILGSVFTLIVLKSPLHTFFVVEDSLVKEEITDQLNRLDSLEKHLNSQNRYYEDLQRILKGETPYDSANVIMKQLEKVDLTSIEAEATNPERKLEQKIKSEMRTGKALKGEIIPSFFVSPVKGAISRGFDPVNHLAIDVVTAQDASILACLSGTIVYSGFSRSEGNVLIIAHGNDYFSVYKHNKTNFKKSGDKINTGDPIAIVGDSGENSSGPHLHFELWHSGHAIDPSKFISFE